MAWFDSTFASEMLSIYLSFDIDHSRAIRVEGRVLGGRAIPIKYCMSDVPPVQGPHVTPSRAQV
jgi:hypothetical protein